METQPVDLINEEDLKAKILLPYIESLGFKIEDITLEKNFSVRLGRKVYPVGGKKEIATAMGRLDILCSAGERNLFIVEAKREESHISQDDIDQGISYARLVHPIVPFVLVTNAKETRVIDVITKENLEGTAIGTASDFWGNDCRLATAAELELRYEALKYFIGYSSENLQAFSSSQTEERMRSLKGDATGSGKKYIPELFLQRDDIVENFQKFIDSPSQCFALIGESGVGKTNFMCGLAEHFSGNAIILFFNAQQLVRGIIDNIKEDFNWVFSSQLEPPEIIRRIETLTEHTHSKVCFFFDAIDEASSKDFNLDLDDFVRKVRNLSNIKICVSCKTSEWERFLTIKGTPTYLSESLFLFDDNSSKAIAAQLDEQNHIGIQQFPGYVVNRFNESEIAILFEKYQQWFKYAGDLTPSIKDECKLGFMLRVVSEVYQGEMLPEVIDSLELFNSYLAQKLKKIEKREIAMNYLREIGRILIENEAEEVAPLLSGQIEEFSLREKLGLSVEAEILPGLFTFNILNRTPRTDGTTLIGFYYTKIRDFVVAIPSLRLPSLNDADFKEILPKMLHGSVGQNALSWYANIANNGHKDILMKYQHSRALLFLNEYTQLIERLFPNLREYFHPHTLGKIGLAISGVSGVFSLRYGFYALRNTHEGLIKQIQVEPEPDIREYNSKLSAEFFKIGVSVIRTRNDDFMSIDPRKAAINEIKEQLKKLLEKGCLNEQNNIGLAIEKTTHILYHYGKRLGLDVDSSHIVVPRVDGLFPIQCDEILNKIKFFNAFIYYERLHEQEYLQKKRLAEGNPSYSIIHRTEIDYAQVHEKATLAIQNNEDIPVPNIRGDFPPFSLLSEAIRIIKKQHAEISVPLLPPPDIPRENVKREAKSVMVDDFVFAQYSDDQLKKYIESFFYLFLQEYKTLVETCFSFVKDKLPLYSLLPLYMVVEAYEKQEFASCKYGYKHNDEGKTIVEAEVNPEKSRMSLGSEGLVRIHSTYLGDIFRVSRLNPVPLDQNVNTRETGRFCIIREWVYQEIMKELKFIEQEF